jgi:PIN domain nuclease of toxin-antitoxin system
MLSDDSHALYVSIVSVWEIAIKTSIGKLYEFEGGVTALPR